MIIHNKIRCKICGDVIESEYIDHRLIRTRTANNDDPEIAAKEAVRMIFDDSKFEVGDVVRFKRDNWHVEKGMIATIKRFRDNKENGVGLETDKNIDGHDCDGYVKWNYGLYSNESAFEHINI